MLLGADVVHVVALLATWCTSSALQNAVFCVAFVHELICAMADTTSAVQPGSLQLLTAMSASLPNISSWAQILRCGIAADLNVWACRLWQDSSGCRAGQSDRECGPGEGPRG